jgi:hypothetical protein
MLTVNFRALCLVQQGPLHENVTIWQPSLHSEFYFLQLFAFNEFGDGKNSEYGNSASTLGNVSATLFRYQMAAVVNRVTILGSHNNLHILTKTHAKFHQSYV